MMRSIIMGVVILFLVFWIFWVIWWVIKNLGMLKMFKRKPKIDEYAYMKVLEMLEEGKNWTAIAEHFSKYPFKEQQKYINAYFEIKGELEKEVPKKEVKK